MLGGIAEAAWIAVYAAAVTASPDGTATLANPVVLSAAALVGVAAGRFVPFGRWRPAALFALAIASVVVAFFAADGSGPVAVSQLQRALGSILVGLAALRGVVHGDPAAGDRSIGELVRLSPVLLGLGWVVGLTITGPARSVFISAALDGSILFIVAGALALGSARLAANAVDSRGAPRADRSWVVLLLVVGAATLVALPVAALVGVPLADRLVSLLFTGVALVASAILGVIGGIGAIGLGLLALLLGPPTDQPSVLPSPLPSPLPMGPETPPPPLPVGTEGALDPWIMVLLVIVSLLALLGTAWYLALRWRGSQRDAGPASRSPERRSFAVEIDVHMPHRRLPARLRAVRPPRNALEAYPRLLEEWAEPDARAREPAETPAAHARRLRLEGNGDLGFDLLAADFELARFGETALTDREERRAVVRWRRLRRVLPGGGSDPPRPTSG